MEQLDSGWVAAELPLHHEAVLEGREQTSGSFGSLSDAVGACVPAVTVKPLHMTAEALTVDVFCHLPFASFISYDITRVNGPGPFAKHNET